MAFIRKYIKDRKFVLSLVRDGANEKLLKEHVKQLTEETNEMHPFVELADASELHDLSGFSMDGLTKSGASEIDRRPHKKDKLAVLVSNDVAHHLALSFLSTSLYYRYDAKVFRDFKESIEWLGVADLEDEINKLRNLS